MKKQKGRLGKDKRWGKFAKTFSPFANRWDEFAIKYWVLPIFGPYLLSKLAGIPIWFRLHQFSLHLGEDAYYLLFAFVLILVVLSFRRWARLIPIVFEAFPEKGLITARSGENSGLLFWDFLDEYQNTLKSRVRFLIIIPLLIFAGWVVFRMVMGDSDVASRIVPYALASKDWAMVVNLGIFYLITPIVWSYLAGVGAWIIGVTGWYLRRLSDQFEVQVQPNHPDKCGGLGFLGNFCFRMVIPILIGSVLLGVIGLAGVILSASDELRLGANLTLILVVLPLTYITFFTPMWGFHLEMQTRKAEFEENLASYISKLDARVNQFLGQEKFDEAKKSMEELKAVASASEKKFPVWPFNLATLANFLTPQIVPVISFIFGVKNEDYIKILDFLANLE